MDIFIKAGLDLKMVNTSRQLLLILEMRYGPRCLEICIAASAARHVIELQVSIKDVVM